MTHSSQQDKSDEEELRTLFPQLTHKELVEAAQNLEAYIEHTMLMYERIRHDPEAYRRFHELTGQDLPDPIEPPAMITDQ